MSFPKFPARLWLAGAFLTCLFGSVSCEESFATVNVSGKQSDLISSFSSADLAGHWVGELIPSNPLSLHWNFYVSFDGLGDPYEAATGQGYEWFLANAVLTSSVTQSGDVVLNLTGQSHSKAILTLTGNFNLGGHQITGSYTFQEHHAVVHTGTFELLLSNGPGHFTVASHLQGTWKGFANGELAARKPLTVLIGEDGSVLGGDIEVHAFVPHGANIGAFQFANDAVGRLENVVIHSSDGATTTLHMLIVNDAGNLMSGPGVDSTMGEGIARVRKTSFDLEQSSQL